MGKMEEVLRSEIRRLARKEMRAELASLVKQVRELRRTVAKLGKGGAAPTTAPKTSPAVKLEAAPADIEKARFSAGLIKKLRKRLGITQVELATIMDVSPTTVAFWEQGRNRPTEASKATLVALRKLGRREVKRILQGKASGH